MKTVLALRYDGLLTRFLKQMGKPLYPFSPQSGVANQWEIHRPLTEKCLSCLPPTPAVASPP